ncbi:hypothetical protein KBC75_02650 [Candidatus Shapirobacteria bacterium]|nr:hypothetical protein [Candidatus Shapirobacteria bacterium]
MIVSKLKNSLTNRRCFYGETYDSHGMTLDSLKYYFFLSLLHRILARSNIKIESTVVIADIASGINKSSQKLNCDIDEVGNSRLAYCEKLKKHFNLPINFVLMSKLFDSEQIKERIKLVESAGQNNQKVIELLSKTVLKNKIKQEEETGFRYGFEAVATGTMFDIKIGPPREKYYDLAAKIICKKLKLNQLKSIYLTPTFPLGQDFSYFLMHPEIEEFGLTPYKAGSNQMQDFRIILNTSIEKVKQLIDDTYITTNPNLPNPILDLLFITDMAEKLKNEESEFPVYKNNIYSNPKKLKSLAIEKITKLLIELKNL